MSRPPVSIVISCFNYERYVGEAIESALAQHGGCAEVIVVDDGSQDASAEVIRGFGDRVQAISKRNGGQASALNAGFAVSSGQAVIFLDADDLLLPGAAAETATALADPEVSKAHWSMPIVDHAGRRTGELQDPELAEGELREHVLREGPFSDMTMPNPPMSGNAFSRQFLDQVMPVPEQTYRSAADEYLFALAPAFGRVVRLSPQSLYRVHGQNDHLGWSFERMLAFQTEHHAVVERVAAQALRRRGAAPDLEAWARSAWWLRAGRVAQAIETAVPPGARFALLDEGSLGINERLRDRRSVPFPEVDGEFAGSPGDDREALAALDRLDGDVPYVAVAWTAFWWLDQYPRFASELRDTRRELLANDDVIIFGS